MTSLRPRLNRGTLAITCALLFSIGWFAYNVTLPAPQRGLTCCDGAEYVSHSGKQDVWTMAGPRVFGYPFFLSVFRRALQGDDITSTGWITPALVTQLLAWFASAFVLFRALEKTGRRYPVWGFVLLLAHTSLSSFAAMTLTDSLATSLFCITIAALIYLQLGLKGGRWPPIVAGVALGLATSMRPSFLVISACAFALVACTAFLRERAGGAGFAPSAKRTLAACVLFAIGFAPFYAKLVSNCYRMHGEICVLDSVTMRRVTSEDIFRGVIAVRWWASLTTDYRSTDDTFINMFAGDCGVQGKVSEDAPFRWLISCYARVPWKVPIVFLKKFASGYDNYFLNAYATDETTPIERAVNRAFCAVGFLGLIMASLHCLVAVFRGRILDSLYLFLPVGYAFAQVNSHIEARYFFPTYPIFFLFACSQLAAFGRKRLLSKVGCAAFVTAIMAYFYIQTWHWDMRDCWYNYNRIPDTYKRAGLMLACPPPDQVREALDTYGRWVPAFPPGVR